MAGGRNFVHSSEFVGDFVSMASDPSGCRMREGELSVGIDMPNPLVQALGDAKDCNPRGKANPQ